MKSFSSSPAAQKFIQHWGEMGARWGINRTVALIYALLYISPKPLSADEISQALSIARSNVSTSLRELQNWRLIRTVRIPGNRADYFISIKDVWEMFQIVLDERKRREVDPSRMILKECTEEIGRDKNAEPYTQERLQELLEFFETVNTCYDQIRCLPMGTVRQLVKAAGKAQALLNFTRLIKR